jgi:hypothetical protein
LSTCALTPTNIEAEQQPVVILLHQSNRPGGHHAINTQLDLHS